MPEIIDRLSRGPLSPGALRARAAIVAGVGVAAAVVMLFVPPIAQDPGYHDFADRRAVLGIPNFFDVVSNAGFAVAGAMGLALTRKHRDPAAAPPFADEAERRAFIVLFAGVIAVAIGSGYYHLAPTNGRLFWDRLPMSVVFMALFAITIAERIHRRLGNALLIPLVLAGVGSTLYWHIGELRGEGDLRLYALVQFYPMLAVPLILLLFPAKFTGARELGIAVGWYALAKLFEALDARIFALGGVVSGHTLKHLAAALATLWIYWMLARRQPAA